MPWHVPILRHGEVYRSLQTAPVPDVRGRDDVGEVSLANAGLLRRDLRRLPAAREALARLGVAERLAATRRAAELFLTAELPCGDELMGPQAYLEACSASTGLPQALVRQNMDKIAYVCREIEVLLAGLTRGLDLTVLDTGVGVQHGLPLSYVPTAAALAAVLPSNSPGVHSLWIPALALQTPVVLKPGSGDPWTPLRLVQALIAGGLPAEAFGFYPADRTVGAELVELHDRAIVFGGPDLAQRYAGRPDVQVHGPGFAKILFGPDTIHAWGDHLELLVTSVARNGGRSCINASTVVVPSQADAVADALAARLAALEPRPLDDPGAGLAAFADAPAAHALDARLTDLLAGARVVGPQGSRVAEVDGLTFLRPTVVRCGPDHPLARTEHGFPFVSVVEVPPERVVDWLGPTLVLTALTEDPALRRALLAADHVDRLHLGPIPTTAIRWDQPHEGDLFAWLWRRRAVAVDGLA